MPGQMMKNRETLLAEGKELMREFCAANAIPEPGVVEFTKTNWRLGDRTCAYYRKDAIRICPAQCAAIGQGGAAWSYPGYVVDRTPYGVIQHELGHHVDYFRSDRKGAYGGDFSIRLRAATREDRITSYCPNDWEWFAEIFRLFVTNSDLLHLYRPKTYEELRDLYRPVVDAPWRTVLAAAPARTIAMAAKKVET